MVEMEIRTKKENRFEKVQLIGNLRTYLLQNNPKSDEFISSQDYAKIRPYLSTELVEELENNHKTKIEVQSSSNFNYYQAKLLEEIELIEDLWEVSLSKKDKIKKNYSSKQSIGITIEDLSGNKSSPNKKE